MDKLLRLATGGALAWVGLSAWLTDGQRMWVGLQEAPDWGKAIAALAAFQLAPYLPSVKAGVGLHGLVSGLLLRLLIVAGPAFAAMTASAGLQRGWDEQRVGLAVGGLVAAVLAWRHLGSGQRRGAAGGSSAASPEVRAAQGSLRSALATIARSSGQPQPSGSGDVRLRYLSSDGSPQFVDLPSNLA